jgi:hypothetical protein
MLGKRILFALYLEAKWLRMGRRERRQPEKRPLKKRGSWHAILDC